MRDDTENTNSAYPPGAFMTPATSRHKDEPERDLLAEARELMSEAMGYDYRGWTATVLEAVGTGGWFYRLAAGNGETLHHSEVYVNKSHAAKMARIANPMARVVVEE